MQILCTVDIRTRELYLEDVTIAAFDHLVDDVLFVIEPIDGFQLETSTIKIAAVGPLGEPHDYEIDPSTVTVDEETGNINFVWSIPVGVTAMPLTAFKISDTKKITFAVCAEIVSGDNLVKAWHSDDGTIKVKAHLEPESGGGEDPSEEATNAQKIAALQHQVSAISSGAPPTAASTAGMNPDVSTTYINTTDGHLYFWNGSDWQIGGIYGANIVDDTVSEAGMAAEAAAVRAALNAKADASDLAALETALESKADADDVDARFDTVEQAIEDVTFDGIDMLVTEISSTTYGGNLMDMSNATRNASYIIRGGRLYHPSSGMFYSNPWGNPDDAMMDGYPKDADGNAIGMTVNGETVTRLRLYSGTGYVVTYEFSDSTHFIKTAYANVNKYNSGDYSVRQEVVLSVAPAYWYCEGKGANLTHGITAEISTTYVPYVAPVVTHSYEYANGLDEHIEEVAGSSGSIAALDTRVSAVEGDVESLAEDLSAKVSTVNGIAPDANGNVEVETGDQEVIDELNEQMGEVLSTSYDYSGNLADTTGVVKTGQYTNYVEFDLVGDGTYYSNPYALNINAETSAKYEIYLLDANGETITATRNSDGTTKTDIGSGYSKMRCTFNGTNVTVTCYLLNGNVNTYEYTLSATPVKVKYRTRWWDADKAQINGFTYGYSSETYVPYSAPSKVYSPNPDFADEIKDYYIADGFIDTTFNDSEAAANSKAVGDELYDRKGITFDTVAGYIRSVDGTLYGVTNHTATDFIPVTPGEVIRVNRPALQTLTDNAYYNASKSFVSALTTQSNISDLTIPSGVYYVRFSDYNEGMVGFSVERTGLWTRIRDAIAGSSGEAEYRNLIEQSRYGTNVLTLLHFSDLHMNNSTMGYINTFRIKYAEFLDDVIQTGDVSNGFESDWRTLVSVGLGDCLGVIGNHEALGSSKNSATQQELHEKYIAPYISGWNVTQPTGVDDSTSEHYCANYYYKDYTDATIRLIVLDTQKWSSAQLSWFTSTLASARTAGYAVVVASHVLPGAVTITDCNFSAKYSDGSNVTHAFPTSDAPLVTEDAVSAVNDFITAGGEFTIWIGGHEHADIFGVFTNYPNVTAYMIDKASIERETPGAARIRGEKNQHAFNIMSIVRDGKLVKFVRIGEDVDGMMRGKHVFCYNYNTKTVISQW